MRTAVFDVRNHRAIGVALALTIAFGFAVSVLEPATAAPATQTDPAEDVYVFGDVPFHGSTAHGALEHAVVGMALTPSGDGYYELASDGGIFAFGDAAFFGSAGAIHLTRPIVGMAVTPTGNGYWLVASDGGIFAFGDAAFFGSTGGIHLTRPIVGMAATPTGNGYWLVASDGGIFAFGDARFFGSTGAIHLTRPIVGMAATPTGNGYWLVASDGGIFAFGDATFYGSMGQANLGAKSVVGIVAGASGHGYAMVATRAPSAAPLPPLAPEPPERPAPVAPSSRRISVTFTTTFSGPDTMVVRYESHDGSRVRFYTCTSPTKQFTYNSGGFAETWTAVGDCGSGSLRGRFAGKFATNYSSPSVLYLRIYYSGDVSFRFVCKSPARYSTYTSTASSEKWASSADCHVDEVDAPAPSVCGKSSAPPSTYQHIVVIMLENRTWSQVGGTGFGALPYTHGFAAQCTYYSQWLEPNPEQDSLAQYIGLTSGIDNPATHDNCAPSTTCRSTDNNIFRQVREAGGTPRSYVEDATAGCSATNYYHVPALYYFGGSDHSFCTTEVRPLTEMNVNALPTFAMVTPNICNNGHNCGNDTVDAWLKLQITKILTGASYQAGNTAIFVLYDEDRPLPNLIIAPTAHRGEISSLVADHYDALRTFDKMLGLSVLSPVSGAVSLRATAHL